MSDNNEFLNVQQLVKRFGEVTAVNSLNLSIREGETLALLGPNGAGKTVTIALLCGLIKPDSGQILFRGQPIDGSFKRIIGLCPQNLILWPKQTCLEQLIFIGEMYGKSSRECYRKAESLLTELQLTEKSRKLAATLSGGMQRRLNLALALMHDPQLLVLDEPEAGLDPQSRVLVREYIRKWAASGQHTVILTTHNMDEADRLAERVAILDHGSLLRLDTPAALKRQVGEGDILEIDLEGSPELLLQTLPAFQAVAPAAIFQDHTLIIRSLGAIDLLPALLRSFNEAGITQQEVRLRNNTLEDVFIALTGRRLRE
jgi:ABC-2 type transport system ATP-binding protein